MCHVVLTVFRLGLGLRIIIGISNVIKMENNSLSVNLTTMKLVQIN